MVVKQIAAALALVSTTLLMTGAQGRAGVKRITWENTAPLHARLEAQGITSVSFAAYVERVHQINAGRVREGDLDHLVYYLLQSTRVTPLPSIEPATSAKQLVDTLDPNEREVFLARSRVTASRVPTPVRARVSALLRAVDSSDRDPRLTYFRGLVHATFPDHRDREAAIIAEYVRVMRFVYEKEFVAQRSTAGPAAVAELYRTRGFSTDTAIEAGYLVYLGLGIVKSLEPERRIRRVLIVGPGLDLAPRTALLEGGPPESYQPWAVMDALLGLGLSRADDLEIVGADINPRVVEHLRRSHLNPPTLTLMSGIQETEAVTLAHEYRDYFAQLGRAIGKVEAGTAPIRADTARATPIRAGPLRKTVRVGPAAARALGADTLDIVTDRLDGPPFDLVVATNVLPYFDDVQLVLAMSNVAAMLAPGGVFLHNEARPFLGDVTAALGLPFEQSRHVVIASVRGPLRPGPGQAPAPLFDSVWLHRKTQNGR